MTVKSQDRMQREGERDRTEWIHRMGRPEDALSTSYWLGPSTAQEHKERLTFSRWTWQLAGTPLQSWSGWRSSSCQSETDQHRVMIITQWWHISPQQTLQSGVIRIGYYSYHIKEVMTVQMQDHCTHSYWVLGTRFHDGSNNGTELNLQWVIDAVLLKSCLFLELHLLQLLYHSLLRLLLLLLDPGRRWLCRGAVGGMGRCWEEGGGFG